MRGRWWRVVGKLKLFPDSEWKHFVAAPAAAGVSSFPVTAAYPARRGIRRRFPAADVRVNLKLERTDSLSLSVIVLSGLNPVVSKS